MKNMHLTMQVILLVGLIRVELRTFVWWFGKQMPLFSRGISRGSCGPGSPWSSISYNSEGSWLHMWPKISKWCRMLKRSQILDTVMLKISSVMWVSTLSLKPVLVLFFKICNLKHPDSGMIFNKGHLAQKGHPINWTGVRIVGEEKSKP